MVGLPSDVRPFDSGDRMLLRMTRSALRGVLPAKMAAAITDRPDACPVVVCVEKIASLDWLDVGIASA